MNRCQCSHCKVTPHASDCALHNEPALPIGPCDCGAMGGDLRYAEGFRAGMDRAAAICASRVMGDNNREDAEARRCEEAIRAAIPA